MRTKRGIPIPLSLPVRLGVLREWNPTLLREWNPALLAVAEGYKVAPGSVDGPRCRPYLG